MKIILLSLVTFFTLQTKNDISATVCGRSQGSITKKQIINCGLSISDTTNYRIATFSIKWFNGTDSTEMPVHNQIPDYFHEMINEIENGTIFHFNNIAMMDKNNNMKFAPSIKFKLVN
jgi:hypothetical protein